MILRLVQIGLCIATALYSVIIGPHGVYAGEGPDVYFGGFALTGRADDQVANFPYILALNQRRASDDTPLLDSIFRGLFREHCSLFEKINLKFALAPGEGSKNVLAFAMTGERVSIEFVCDVFKCCINLSGLILILDYENMTVVSSYPLIWEYIHVFKTAPEEEQIIGLLLSDEAGFTSEFFQRPLLELFPWVTVEDRARRTVRLLSVDVEEEALPFLPTKYAQDLDAYKAWLAEQYSALLSSELDLAILPYAKDAANAKMALRFMNSEMLMFTIPDPTYGIDLTLRKFKKVVVKETRAERLLVYGAYIKSKLYEPEFNKIYFEDNMKVGVPKKIPISQKQVDDCAAYQETLKNVLLSSTEVMMQNGPAREVLEQCKRK